MKLNRQERIAKRAIKAKRLHNLELARTTKFMCYSSHRPITTNTFVTISSCELMQDRTKLLKSA